MLLSELLREVFDLPVGELNKPVMVGNDRDGYILIKGIRRMRLVKGGFALPDEGECVCLQTK